MNENCAILLNNIFSYKKMQIRFETYFNLTIEKYLVIYTFGFEVNYLTL